MGRRAKTGYDVMWKRGWAYARFTHASTDYRIALGTKDPGEAQERAQKEYAAVLSGRRKPVASVHRSGRPLLGLAELLAEWVAAQEGVLDKETCETLTTYAKHYLGFFGTMDRCLIEGATGDYVRARLRQVLRKTVLKEASYLRSFFNWCVEHGALDVAPLVPTPPKKATGKRAGKQRSKPVEISGEQAESIIEALPEFSKTIDGRKWPVRGRFRVLWETGLRPETIDLLRVPENYTRGSATLTLSDEQDKARFGRSLPLTAAARAALDAVAPDEGLIFGAHNFNKVLKRAAATVLGPEPAKRFASYDFRHGRATYLLDSGAPLTGVAYLHGHRRTTTTDRYVKPNLRAAETALATLPSVAPYPPQADFESPALPPKSTESLGWPTGLEPATPGATTQASCEFPQYSEKSIGQERPDRDAIGSDSRTRGGYRSPRLAAQEFSEDRVLLAATMCAVGHTLDEGGAISLIAEAAAVIDGGPVGGAK